MSIMHFAGNDKCGGSNQVVVEQFRIPRELDSCQLGGYIETKSSVYAFTKTD